ncbi:MAG TPA: GNAT family N-acetyltransferase [Firmicutes bacterium]|nr:GNAT family N-acetyltransferase [Bacillota bacterium]
MTVRSYREQDVAQMCRIWNEVVEEGAAFPQTESLDGETGSRFFAEQTFCGVAEEEDGRILGLYILHPNNVGRCGHISNASFAVGREARGKHIGELLVRDCLTQAKAHGFRLIQFNAVVKTNAPARHLYQKLGFVELGSIPGGFLKKDGVYEDIVLYYHTL